MMYVLTLPTTLFSLIKTSSKKMNFQKCKCSTYSQWEWKAVTLRV